MKMHCKSSPTILLIESFIQVVDSTGGNLPEDSIRRFDESGLIKIREEILHQKQTSDYLATASDFLMTCWWLTSPK